MAKPITSHTFILMIGLPLILSSGVPIIVSPGLNISTDPNITPNLAPCTNLTYSNAPTIPCYTKLQVTPYLENFNSTLAEVCSPTQLWSQCLLLSIYTVAGVNCTTKLNTTTLDNITSTSSTTTCVPFDCATLNSSACPSPTPSTLKNITIPQAQGWYSAWSLYSVNNFLSTWALALNHTSSEPAILSVLSNTTTNTATSVLVSLVSKYGLNSNVDAKLLQLAQVKTAMPEPYVQIKPGKGGDGKPSLSQWRTLLVNKMQSVSFAAAGNFTSFMGMAGKGDFSVRGLAGVDALVKSLGKGG